jgi:hypothetical protein
MKRGKEEKRKRGKELPSLSSTGRFGTEGAGAGWRAVTAYDCPKSRKVARRRRGGELPVRMFWPRMAPPSGLIERETCTG